VRTELIHFDALYVGERGGLYFDGLCSYRRTVCRARTCIIHVLTTFIWLVNKHVLYMFIEAGIIHRGSSRGVEGGGIYL